MYQTCLYDYLDYQSDPLFQKLEKLKQGESMKISIYVVSFTVFERYEIASQNVHEMYQTIFDVYKQLNVFLNEGQFFTL